MNAASRICRAKKKLESREQEGKKHAYCTKPAIRAILSGQFHQIFLFVKNICHALANRTLFI